MQRADGHRRSLAELLEVLLVRLGRLDEIRAEPSDHGRSTILATFVPSFELPTILEANLTTSRLRISQIEGHEDWLMGAVVAEQTGEREPDLPDNLSIKSEAARCDGDETEKLQQAIATIDRTLPEQAGNERRRDGTEVRVVIHGGDDEDVSFEVMLPGPGEQGRLVGQLLEVAARAASSDWAAQAVRALARR